MSAAYSIAHSTFNLQELNYGIFFFTICLNIAAELALEGTFDELSKNITEYEHDRHMNYLLREVEKYVKLCPKELKFSNQTLASELLDKVDQQI